MTDNFQIRFKPMTADDLSLVKKWMEAPHWKEWWGESESELDDMRDMIEGKDTSRPFIFYINEEAAGYIQYWFVGHHQNESWIKGYPWLRELSADMIGIDLSIGDEKKLNKGIGPIVLKTFANRLMDLGYEKIIIDPDKENERAIRAYKKAGFVPMKNSKADDILLMQYQTK